MTNWQRMVEVLLRIQPKPQKTASPRQPDGRYKA